MSSTSILGKLCAAFFLIVISCIMIAGGVVVLVVTSHLRHSAWMEVLKTRWSSAGSLFTGIEVVAALNIGLSVIGILATCFRQRHLLLAYAAMIFVLLVIFILITVASFVANKTAMDWKKKAYPAKPAEEPVKGEFDRVYCYAQGAYFCNSMSVSDAVELFLPGANTSFLANVSEIKGAGQLCEVYGKTIVQLKPVCDGCAQAKAFRGLSSVVDWANTKCPRTKDTLIWCGVYLSATAKMTPSGVGTAPYTQCRSEFLGLMSSTALILGWGGLVVCAGAVLMIFFCWYLGRVERYEKSVEASHAVTIPPAAAAVQETPPPPPIYYARF